MHYVCLKLSKLQRMNELCFLEASFLLQIQVHLLSCYFQHIFYETDIPFTVVV